MQDMVVILESVLRKMTTTMIRIRNFTIPACYCYRCCYFADDYAVDRYVSVARIRADPLRPLAVWKKTRGMRDFAYGVGRKEEETPGAPVGSVR